MTASQERVLMAVRRICADGWPATVREVATEAGTTSLSTVHGHLQALEVLGMIETNPRHPARRGGWRPTRLGLQQPPPAVS